MNDWKNIFALDISLKNDVRMSIADCKRDKNGELVYHSIYYINYWKLVEVVHYTNSDKYDFNHRDDRAKEFLGNDSLIYLLDNYKKAYDFYMSVPEVDCVNYENLRGTFDEKNTEFVYYVYDKETNEVIGVGKLYREKNWIAKKYDDGSATASENANKEESADVPATERTEPTENVVFPEAAESPSG